MEGSDVEMHSMTTEESDAYQKLNNDDGASSRGGDDDDLELPDEMPVRQLILQIAHEVNRTRLYGTMPLYLMFLSIFTANVVLTNIGDLSLNKVYYLNQSVKQIAATDVLEQISQVDDIWKWLDEAVLRAWGLRADCKTDNFDDMTIRASDGIPAPIPTYPASSQRDCCVFCSEHHCNAWTYDGSTCNMFISIHNYSSLTPSPGVTVGIRDTKDLEIHVPFIPISMFVIRQWRVNSSTCDIESTKFKPIPSRDRGACYVNGICADSWSNEDARTTAPYGPGMQTPVGNEGFVSESSPHLSNLDYISPKSELVYSQSESYVIADHYGNPLTEMQGKLAHHHQMGWVDSDTRAVKMDLIFYNPDVDHYVHFTGLVEMFTSGAVLASYRSVPFKIWGFHESVGYVAATFDAICALAVVVFLFETIRQTILTKRHIQWATREAVYFTVWNMFEAVNLLTMTITYIARLNMWIEGDLLYNGDYIANHVDDFLPCPDNDCEERVAFKVLTGFSAQAYQSTSWFAPSIILAYLRLFKYLKHNSRLNQLSETISAASGDLGGMFLIFVICLVGFAVAGALLFAHDLEEFQTFLSSASYLTRLLFTGDLGLWDKLTATTHASIVVLYLGVWLLVSWLILLNMILAVIAGAFSVVQDNMKSGTKKGIATDFINYCQKYICCRTTRSDVDRYDQLEDEYQEPEEKTPQKKSCCGIRREKRSFAFAWGSLFITKRINMITAIREHYTKRLAEKRKKELRQAHQEQDLYLINKLSSEIDKLENGLLNKANTDKIMNRIVVLADLEAIRYAATTDYQHEILTEKELVQVFTKAKEEVMTDQVALKVGERSLARVEQSIAQMKAKVDQFSRKVGDMKEVVDGQGAAIDDMQMTSSKTAKHVDKISARVKQAVVTVNENADSVHHVAKKTNELLYTTQDIAASIENERRDVPIESSLKKPKRPASTPSLSGSVSFAPQHSFSIPISPPSRARDPPQESGGGEVTTDGYSWGTAASPSARSQGGQSKKKKSQPSDPGTSAASSSSGSKKSNT
eukprot:TRINITY_DN641_c0_g1_i4.p1 TRINITY_DN641_c0_g1~~TRINITY_DN641_c0_g1_i4.p1  ORF type:complete len:1035 (+),score=209.89 TRINITY_DN641_c0_g1_i4:74-3178(+)